MKRTAAENRMLLVRNAVASETTADAAVKTYEFEVVLEVPL
jgi:hypothetical protein